MYQLKPVFTTRCVDISILEDNGLEGDQTFTVTLNSTPDPDVMPRIDVTIIDNDADGQERYSKKAKGKYSSYLIWLHILEYVGIGYRTFIGIGHNYRK